MHRTNRVREAVTALALCLALLSVPVAVAADEQAAAAKTGGSAGPARPVDLNRASAEELTVVPGIGKALAQRIVDFREQHGPFARVEDLMKVKGIGEKSFEKIRPHITVSAKR